MQTNKYPQNLVLEGYGVKLKRLTHDKIELLRQWRNDPKIQKKMIYRETITPEMQEKWFQKINNDHNFYFLIEFDGKEIGLINEKDIDYEKKCGEPGIFIYDESLYETGIPIKASFLMKKFIFHDLGLHYEYGHVLANNQKAMAYNIALGAELMQSDNPDILLLKRTCENFDKTLQKYEKILNRL